MPKKKSSIINIALVGGGDYCRDIIEKSFQDYTKGATNSRIVAVADPDPKAPGIKLAKKLGLTTVKDLHELYKPEYRINLLTVLSPEESILQDILSTKPDNIRVLSYQAFDLFRKILSIEENKLRKRNEEIETILNGIQDYIVVINPDMIIEEINDTFLHVLEHSSEEVVGQKCHRVFHGLDHECTPEAGLVCPLKEVVRSKMPYQQIITRERKKGDKRYVELTTFPIWEKSGKISKFVEISRDITRRKLEEEEITHRLEKMVEERTREVEETHEQLLHQDKMASLGKLSASVVHEINNPIAGILNLVILIKRIIKEGAVTDKEMEQFGRYLELMETETRRVSGIISNLLAFSRQSKIEFKRISINLLIDKALILNSNILKLNNIEIKKKFDPQLPSIVGSGDQLQQVFMNFVSNAIEALEPKGGGWLSIETKYSKEKDNVVIRIKDSGTGMPRENFSRLFEPFFTTKKKGKGVGLGLSVAYGIIEEHGGSIYVNSKEGKGTTFKIFLPLEYSSDRVSRQGGKYEQN